MATHVSSTGEEPARDLEETLAAESRRLEKLWDAYKAQEQELTDAVGRVQRLTAELSGRDEAKAAVETSLREKDAEVERLKAENAKLQSDVQELEGLKEDLKVLDSYKDRIATLESAYAAERERLAKLYLVYEELESELKALQGDVGKAPAPDG